jgi:Glycosyl transferase family 2
MTGIAVIVPTIGRPELGNCLAALARGTTEDDRVMVMCDRPRRYDWCSALVEGVRKTSAKGRWRVLPRDNQGCYGHPLRNEAVDHLQELDHRPDWVWSLDDDDMPTADALGTIREAVEVGDGDWYVFQMVGGGDSHFAGVTIPNRGHYVLSGNVGTPMMVFPTTVASRFGLNARQDLGREWEPGYFGDLEMAVALRDELGDPVWVEAVVAEIRPSPVVPASILPA